MPTEEGNGYPKGVVWPGLVNINLDEAENTLYSDDCLFLRDTGTRITGEFGIPETKMSRKRFKKLLMSKGICRDTAEHVCNLVASHKGSYGRSWVSFNLLGFSVMIMMF